MLNFTSCCHLGQMRMLCRSQLSCGTGGVSESTPLLPFKYLSTFNTTTIALHTWIYKLSVPLTERQVGRQKANKVPHNIKKNGGGRGQEGARGAMIEEGHTDISAEKDVMKKYTPVLSARSADH